MVRLFPSCLNISSCKAVSAPGLGQAEICLRSFLCCSKCFTALWKSCAACPGEGWGDARPGLLGPTCSLLARVPADQFVLALTVQLGVCIFLMFADMEGVYSIFDVSAIPGGALTAFPCKWAGITADRRREPSRAWKHF